MALEDLLRGVVGAVEASSYERLCLWRHHYQGNWKQSLEGICREIGRLDDMPVCLSLIVDEVSGYRILFWEATSMVVDHRIIDKWFETHLPDKPRVDAMNFCNVFPREAKAA